MPLLVPSGPIVHFSLCNEDPAQTRQNLPPKTQCSSHVVQVLPPSSPRSCLPSRPPSPGRPFPTTSERSIPVPEWLMDCQKPQLRALGAGTRPHRYCLASSCLHAGLGGGAAVVHRAGCWSACWLLLLHAPVPRHAPMVSDSAWRCRPCSVAYVRARRQSLTRCNNPELLKL